MLDRPYYIRNRVNALSYCMFMCDVTFLDNQRQDNSVWLPGYRQENQGIVVQFSGGQQVCLFSRASRLALQATYPPIQCRPRAISAVGKAASVYRNTPLPYVFMVCTGTTLISRKVWAVCIECRRKDINRSKHIA